MGLFKVVTGVMGCGKSTRFISDYNALIYRKCSVITMKSVLDTRDGDAIKSRNMSETVKADFLLKEDSKVPLPDIVLNKINYIMVDEAQFLSQEQIMELYRLSTFPNVNVILYGLRMCWKGVPFTTMQLAIGMADEVEVIKVYNDRGEELTHQIITKGGVPLPIDKDAPEVYIGDIVADSTQASGKSNEEELNYHTVTKMEFYNIYGKVTL